MDRPLVDAVPADSVNAANLYPQSSAKIMAKDYVRSKKYVEKFYAMRT